MICSIDHIFVVSYLYTFIFYAIIHLLDTLLEMIMNFDKDPTEQDDDPIIKWISLAICAVIAGAPSFAMFKILVVDRFLGH